MFCNRVHFYGEKLLAACPTHKREDHPLSAVCDWLFNIFADTPHIGGHSPSTTWGRTMLWWQEPTYHGTETDNCT